MKLSIVVRCIFQYNIILLVFYRISIQFGVEYCFDFDKKSTVIFNKPCNVYTINFTMICNNNYSVGAGYTGIWGLSGDEDNYGFCFTYTTNKCSGLLFEFQQNRTYLFIHILSEDSNAITIPLCATSIPLAYDNSISSSNKAIYESYPPSQSAYRVEFTLCSYSAQGYIGNYKNKMIAGINNYKLIYNKIVVDNIDNKKLTIDYYEKSNIYSYYFLKENAKEVDVMDVYSNTNKLMGKFKKKENDMYEVKYIENKYLYMNKYYEYTSKCYSLEDIFSSCFFDIENGERGCEECKKNTLSYICVIYIHFYSICIFDRF